MMMMMMMMTLSYFLTLKSPHLEQSSPLRHQALRTVDPASLGVSVGQNVALYAAIVDPASLGVSLGQNVALYAAIVDPASLGVSVGQNVPLCTGIVGPSERGSVCYSCCEPGWPSGKALGW